MEKDRRFRVISVVALVLAIAGISIGFAAFSRDLEIDTITGNINPADTFDVRFGKTTGTQTTGTITGTGTGSATGTATIDTGGLITNIVANFVNPGDSVVFNFFATNNSTFIAYLNSINFVENAPVCAATAENGASSTTVSSICDDFEISINVGGESETTASNYTDVATITGNSIAKKVDSTMYSAPITLTLTYKSTGDYADGGVTVTFGSIVLTYSTVD